MALVPLFKRPVSACLHRSLTYAQWMLYSTTHVPYGPLAWSLTILVAQDNLHSGPASPTSLRACDIDTLLPSSEHEFDSWNEPKLRRTLEDIKLAPENSVLARGTSRSLFASLIQIRHYWGTIARKSILHERDTDHWDIQSYFSTMAGKLTCWEEALPEEHTWNVSYVRGYGSVGQDVVGSRTCWEYRQHLTRRRHILK